MNNILMENEEALKIKMEKGFFERYEEQKRNCGEENPCVIRKCENGSEVICRVQEHYEWRLNSLCDPERAAADYADRYAKLQDFAMVCFFGLSDGRVLREVLELGNGTQTFLIYEPDMHVFFAAMEHFPLDDLLLYKKNIYFVVKGISELEISEFLGSVITYQNKDLLVNCVLPNYDILYEDEYLSFCRKMGYAVREQIFRKNTECLNAGKMCDNTFHNFPYLLNGSTVNELIQYFKKYEIGEIPAIIVSAGPSLDRNIKELKKAEGKAFIIGVDSALKALVREQIQFQIAVSVDPGKNPDVFADDRIHRYPVMMSVSALPLIAERNENRIFFETGYGFRIFEELIREETGKETGSIRNGGSVATSALALALDLGFHNIIFVGQDLAFTDGRGHVSGFEKSEQANREHVAKRIRTEVEAYGGGRIITDVQMDVYRQWFELVLEENRENVTAYNATEGGARIRGTIEISLKDAIAQLCLKEQEFDQMIASVPYAFSDEERQRLIGQFPEIDKHLDEVKEKFQEGIENYKQLVSAEEKRDVSRETYKALLKKVEVVNRMGEEELCMDMVQMYASREAYKATADIYSAEDMSVREIAERGIRLLEEYIRGIDICRMNLKSMIEATTE